MKQFLAVVAVVIIIILVIGLPIFFGATPAGKAAWNNWFYKVQKVDDATNYMTRKQVEDTCRSMIVSYTADKYKYEQYISSDDPQQKEWGEQAKMRANQTAAQYNEFIMKNSFVFEDNIPIDIYMVLEYLK